jgi:hypothetical protein
MLPKNVATWHIEYFKMKEIKKWPVQERIFWPYLVADYKTLMQEVISLYLEELAQ